MSPNTRPRQNFTVATVAVVEHIVAVSIAREFRPFADAGSMVQGQSLTVSGPRRYGPRARVSVYAHGIYRVASLYGALNCIFGGHSADNVERSSVGAKRTRLSALKGRSSVSRRRRVTEFDPRTLLAQMLVIDREYGVTRAQAGRSCPVNRRIHAGALSANEKSS